MNMQFFAESVEYVEEIGGDLIQVSFYEDPDEKFDEDSDDDPFDSKKKYLTISQLYEFPGGPSIQWSDGETWGDSSHSKVSRYKLTEQLFELKMTNNVTFTIHHNGPKKVLAKIRNFLQNEFGAGQ